LKARNIVILLVVLAVLGGVFYAVNRPKPGPPKQPQEYVWLIEQDDISHVILSLPRENPPLSQSFIRIKQEDKFPWFFDDAARSPVDAQTWGGGIPLLLSGPGADRIITDNATVIILEIANRPPMSIEVGDVTPDGKRHYVKAPGTNAVATVDGTWWGVLEKLVLQPPYAKPATTKP
jgi:hypothetical protein